MKKWLTTGLLALLCALCAAGLGEDADAVFRAAHPGYAIAAQDAWGDTAAAVMEGDGRRLLLVAEKQDGAWQVVIDNPNALPADGPCPTLLLDTNTALYWSYPSGDGSGTLTFSSFRGEDGWGAVGLIGRSGASETQVFYNGRNLHVQQTRCDENDNVISSLETTALPGRWMKELITLAHFDLEKLPHGYAGAWNWPGEYALTQAAKELFPDYAYLDGQADGDCLRFLLRRPDGKAVFVGMTQDDIGLFRTSESTPLPQDAQVYLGDENFTSALVIEWADGRRASLVFTPYADGSWGLRQCPHFVGTQLGRNWMQQEEGHRVFGAHPWSDITAIDWAAVPTDEAQLRASFDTTGWATPNNPNPADRLHLRTAADRGAASLGKYYNGTPVQVITRGNEWTKVDVCGVQGYMMTKYLAFGEDMAAVAGAAPAMQLRSAQTRLYVSPQEDASYEIVTQDPLVIGILGETWYHVWYPDTGLSGWMKQDDLWPGNG